MTGRIHVGLDEVPESTDVLVIGLGITGAGVALDAASRGLDVVAVDAHDVAFGTSRWSSKLVHGGLRYLQPPQREFRLVYENLHERQRLLTNAPQGGPDSRQQFSRPKRLREVVVGACI